MKVILIGGSEVVFFLCRTLLSKGYEVSIVNNNRDECERMSKQLRALIIHGEGSDPKILEDAGARSAKMLISVTPHDHINLVCCQMASMLYNIPQTLALVNDPDNYEIFKKLGIDNVLNQTEQIVSMLEREVDYDYLNHLLTYADGQVLFNEIIIGPRMPAVGKLVSKLDLPAGARIIGLLRGKVFQYALRDTIIEAHDRLVLSTTPENHAKTLRILCGEDA